MVKSEISISYEKKPSSSDLNLIRNGIFAESHLKRGLLKGEDFYFLCKDNNEKIIGGITGYILYGCLHIDELWIENKYRNQRMGIIKNCSFCMHNGL